MRCTLVSVGIGYRKRIRLGRGLSLNLSRRGAGVSAGPKGAKVSAGPSGRRLSLSWLGFFSRRKL
jgi:hypothetical protein